MNKYSIWILALFILVACKNPQPRYPISHSSGTFLKESAIRNKKLVKNEEQIIDAFNQFYYLVEEAENVRVESETGIFDLSESSTNEMQYEHQSKIQITNYLSGINHLRFIQVIPKHKIKKKR